MDTYIYVCIYGDLLSNRNFYLAILLGREGNSTPHPTSFPPPIPQTLLWLMDCDVSVLTLEVKKLELKETITIMIKIEL